MIVGSAVASTTPHRHWSYLVSYSANCSKGTLTKVAGCLIHHYCGRISTSADGTPRELPAPWSGLLRILEWCSPGTRLGSNLKPSPWGCDTKLSCSMDRAQKGTSASKSKDTTLWSAFKTVTPQCHLVLVLTRMVGLGEELDPVNWVLVFHRIVVLQELDNHVLLPQVVIRSLAGHDLCRVDVFLWNQFKVKKSAFGVC